MDAIYNYVPTEPLPFPPGENSTDTLINGVHLNRTALDLWHYFLWPNGTLSNESTCVVAEPKYMPVYVFGNGSFTNSTNCYSAVREIDGRGYASIALSVLYGLLLVISITVLAKHGRLYLPTEKRFYPVGRRWQWYWALFVCACALISLIINIDVDRYWVQELPLVVTCFFWFLMCQGTTALVWEATRHWGSWQERQFIDPDPFILPTDDRRAKLELLLPLWFYLWVWLNFFLVIPRNWTFVERQNSPQQIVQQAIPGAMEPRFKAGAFCLVVAWLTIIYSLRHSIKHYKPKHEGVINKARGFIGSVPIRLALLLLFNAVLIAYQIFMCFSWYYSLFRFKGELGAQYGWGYGPSLVIMIIQAVYGFFSPNEDKELIRQRRERGEALDRELGIVHRPAWWRRIRGDHIQVSMRDRIKNNVTEVGGVRGTGRRAETEFELQLRRDAATSANPTGELPANHPRADRAGVRNMSSAIASEPTTTSAPAPQYTGRSQQRQSEVTLQSASQLLFPGGGGSAAADDRARRLVELQEDGPPPPYVRDTPDARANSTSTTRSTAVAPQQIRSMLDV